MEYSLAGIKADARLIGICMGLFLLIAIRSWMMIPCSDRDASFCSPYLCRPNLATTNANERLGSFAILFVRERIRA